MLQGFLFMWGAFLALVSMGALFLIVCVAIRLASDWEHVKGNK